MLSALIGNRRYSTQHLTRDTSGRLDRWRLQIDHKLASRRFEAERRVDRKELEVVFPGLSKTSAIIRNAVAGPVSLANADPNEVVIISTLCAYLKPKLIVEFGTFDGLTALHLAMNSPADAKVITVDLPPDDPFRQSTNDDTFYSQGVTVGEHFTSPSAPPEAKKVEQVFCDTTKFDQTPLAGRANLLFIDAGHSYDLVKSDSEKALQMVAPCGVILWHDYHYAHEGVYTWLNELAGKVTLFQIPGTKFVCHVAAKS